MIFRAEATKDYSGIASLTYSAFLGWRNEDLYILEPDMIALARQSAMFDSGLSIVAEDGGKIVGHILLIPADFVVLGKTIKGVILGPVSVAPDLQKQGIGAKLIEYANEKAKDEGYEFCLLCGHPEYYPKLGFLQNVFSFSGTKITQKTNGNRENAVKQRPLTLSDLDIIDKWQSDLRRDEPFALLFEKDIMDYHAYAKEKTGEILEMDGEPIAYAKYKTYHPDKIDFIFYDRNKLVFAIDFLMSKRESGSIEISQPYNLFKELLPADRYVVTDVRKTSDAFMIKPFYEKRIINEYCEKTKDEAEIVGVISFPPYCDVD